MEKSENTYNFELPLSTQAKLLQSLYNDKQYSVVMLQGLNLFSDNSYYGSYVHDKALRSADILSGCLAVLDDLGNVFLLKLPKKKSKKKRKKHIAEASTDDTNKDIFSGLLSNESATKPGKPGKPGLEVEGESYYMTENDCLISVKGACHVALSVGKVLVLTRAEGTTKCHTVTVIDSKDCCLPLRGNFTAATDLAMPVSRNHDVNESGVVDLRSDEYQCKVVAEFKLGFDDETVFSDPCTLSGLSTTQQLVKTDTDMKASVFYKASSIAADHGVEMNTNHDYMLTDVLFQHVIEADLALLGCPFMIVSTPTGKAWRIPCGSIKLEPKIFYDMQQPIVGIFGYQLENGEVEAQHPNLGEVRRDLCNSLLVVGALGTLVLVAVIEGNLRYFELRVDFPIYTATVYKEVLVFSTLLNLHLCKLCYSKEKKEIDQKTQKVGFYNAARVNVITPPKDNGTSAGNLVDLDILTAQGRLYRIRVSTTFDSTCTWNRLANGGQTLKALLSSINIAEREIVKVRAFIAERDRSLQRLCLCSHLVTSYVRSQASKDRLRRKPSTSPLEITSKIDSYNLDATRHYTLVITILNRSKLPLLDGFLVNVHVEGSPTLSQGRTDPGTIDDLAEENKHYLNFSQTCQLATLSLNEKQDIHLGLDSNSLVCNLPLCVTVEFSILLATDNQTTSFHVSAESRSVDNPIRSCPSLRREQQKSSITVPVFSRYFDALDFLINTRSTKDVVIGDRNIGSRGSRNNSDKIGLLMGIESLARQRPCFEIWRELTSSGFDSGERKGAAAFNVEQNLFFSLLICKETAQHLLGKAYKRALRQGSLPTAVLSQLCGVLDGQEGNSTAGDGKSAASLTRLSHRRQQVLITIGPHESNTRGVPAAAETCNEASASDRGENEGIAKGSPLLLLRVHAFAIADLVELRHAFLERLKVPLQGEDGRDFSRLSEHQMRVQIRQLQVLSNKIENFERESSSMTDTVRRRTLTQLYCILRNIPSVL